MESVIHTRLMSLELPTPIAAYIQAVNNHDLEALLNCFADDALVNPRTREFWGRDAIRRWAEKEIINERVTMTVTSAVHNHGNYAVRAEFRGDFDKTGLPDPFALTSYFSLDAEKIVQLIVLFNNPAEV